MRLNFVVTRDELLAAGQALPRQQASGRLVPFLVDPGASKWTRWFRENPLWPELLTKAAWDKNKSTLAKMTLSTGIGEQLKVCEPAF
jgi:hypothetical protein